MKPLFHALALVGAVAVATPAAAETPLSPVHPAPTAPAAAGGAAHWVEPPAASEQMPDRAAAAGGETHAAQMPAERRAAAAQAGRHNGIRPGQWQFTVRLLGPAPPSQGTPTAPSPATAQAGANDPEGGAATTYSACVDRDNAVPTGLAPHCTLDRSERRGSRIAWAMSCPQTHVRADGTAQYHGDRMEAELVSHLPGPEHGTTDVRQQISGRYLGPCTAAAAATPQPQPPTAPNPPAASVSHDAGSPATAEPAASAPPQEARKAASAETAAPAATPAPPPQPTGAAAAETAAPAATATPAPPQPAGAAAAETSAAAASAAPEEPAPGHEIGHRRHHHRRHYAYHGYHRYHYRGWAAPRPSWGGAAHPWGPSPYSTAGP